MAVEQEPLWYPSELGVDAGIAQSPVPPDFEQAAATVEAGLGLAQTHLVDRFPNITSIDLTDPEDGSHWIIDLSRRNAAGKLSLLRMYNPDDDEIPELFQIGSRMLTRPSAGPMITADHVIKGRTVSDKGTLLQVGKLAEAKLRSLLGIPRSKTERQLIEETLANIVTHNIIDQVTRRESGPSVPEESE